MTLHVRGTNESFRLILYNSKINSLLLFVFTVGIFGITSDFVIEMFEGLKKRHYRYNPHGTKPLQITFVLDDLKMKTSFIFYICSELGFLETDHPVRPMNGVDDWAQRVEASHMTVS